MSEDSLGQRAEVLPSILDLLDLEYVEENLYRSCAVYRDEYRLFGGQVAAQAVYAAGRTVPDGRLPHSLHGYFLRQGATVKPTLFRVERDRDGQSFSARRVVAIQDGEVIFNMAASFTAARPGADADAEPGPELTAPDLLPSWVNPRHTSFECRSAQQERRLPGQFWIRCTAELPDDPMLHAAILAYVSTSPTGSSRWRGGHAVGSEPGSRGLVPPPGAGGRLDLAGPDPAYRGRRPRPLHRGDLQPRRSARREHRARGPLQEEARKGSTVTGTLAGKTILSARPA